MQDTGAVWVPSSKMLSLAKVQGTRRVDHKLTIKNLALYSLCLSHECEVKLSSTIHYLKVMDTSKQSLDKRAVELKYQVYGHEFAHVPILLPIQPLLMIHSVPAAFMFRFR